jgi:hypothetical protein
MNSKNQVDKLVWRLVEHIKDTVTQNVAAAVQSGEFTMEREKLEVLLSLVSASVSAGGQAAAKDFDKQVVNFLVPDAPVVESHKQKK